MFLASKDAATDVICSITVKVFLQICSKLSSDAQMQIVVRGFFRGKNFFVYEIQYMNRCSEHRNLELTKYKIKGADVSLCVMFL